MAIDPGDVRTGIAVCDPLELLASPLCVIKQTEQNGLVEKIGELVVQNGIEKLVVGNPRNMDGSRGERADKVLVLAEALRKATQLSVVLWDERSTTVLANKILTINEQFGKKRREIVDAVAAVLILESYLNFRKISQG